MFKLSKLKNGINLLKIPVKGTKSLTVLALFPVGSRYEEKSLEGASHFVEHMIFKGTEKRPQATDISKMLDAYGADYNAFTSKDFTGYYIKIAAERQFEAYDVLSDVIYHSTFLPEEVEKEKGAIVEELRMYRDNPMMHIDLLFDTLIFGDSPLGRDIGGSSESVRSLTREALFQYYKQHYSPRNMVLVLAGAISPKLDKQLKNFFEEKKGNRDSHGLEYYRKTYSKFAWPEKELSLQERLLVVEKKLDQVNLILGFPGLNNNHPDRFAASILINILGSGMSSRLFVEVREKRGLAYMIRAGSTSYRDVGVVQIQAGLDPARLFEALQVVKAEIVRIALEPVTDEELENAKTNISGRLALSLEDSSTQAEWYGKQYLFNSKIEEPEQILAKIRKVTKKDVLRLAKRLFDLQKMRLAVIGPLPKAEVTDIVSKL